MMSLDQYSCNHLQVLNCDRVFSFFYNFQADSHLLWCNLKLFNIFLLPKITQTVLNFSLIVKPISTHHYYTYTLLFLDGDSLHISATIQTTSIQKRTYTQITYHTLLMILTPTFLLLLVFLHHR